MQVTEPIRPAVAVLTVVRPPEEIPLNAAARKRVRLAELRLDRFPQEEWKGLVAVSRREFPAARLLLTIRFAKDGGAWPDDEPRAEAMARALSLTQWDYVDVEWDAHDRQALEPLLRRHAAWTRLVCSRHDFAPPSEGLEAALDSLRGAAQAQGAAVAKWAGMLADPSEVRTLCAYAALHREGGAVPSFFAMGLTGLVTRVASPLLAGGWSYGHDGVGEAAPGQLPWAVLDALLQSLPAAVEPSEAWLEGVSGAIDLALRA